MTEQDETKLRIDREWLVSRGSTVQLRTLKLRLLWAYSECPPEILVWSWGRPETWELQGSPCGEDSLYRRTH
jgi:hypothetical protein